MGSCLYCTWEKGKAITIKANPDSTCTECGFVQSLVFRATYEGVFDKPGEQRLHIFTILEPFDCPQCGIRREVFATPCGGSYIWEFEVVPENIEDRV